MRVLSALLILGLVLMCTGCATSLVDRLDDQQVTQGTGDDLERLLEFGELDLKSALVLARAANDVPAMACYPMLMEWLSQLKEYRQEVLEQTVGEGATSGVFVAYQRSRNIRRRIEFGVPESVEVACAALVRDSRGAILRFLLRLAPGA